MTVNMNDRVKTTSKIIAISDLFDMLVKDKTLHPNPIYQRPPTFAGYQHAKNVGIIESIFKGFGIDTLVFRDISEYDMEDEGGIRKLYPTFKYLVIDAAHRCRAVRAFIQNKFYINLDGEKKYYNDLSDEELQVFLNTKVMTKFVVCNSDQSRQLFLAINKMTKTNEIETIMSDDTNTICRWIRENTWFYHEYKNRHLIHPIFKVTTSDVAEHETDYWNKPNVGGSFFYHALIVLSKSFGHGNVDAGQKTWEKLINEETVVTSKVQNVWTKFFDDLKEYQDVINHSGKINDEIFGFFACVWFELLSKYGIDGFKIDMDTFASELAQKRSELTGKFNKSGNNKYDTMIMENLEGVETDVKSIIREYVKAFAYGEKQAFAGRYILSEMGDDPSDYGVVALDKRKNPSKRERELMLNRQKNCCFIDKLPLILKDAHAAHIISRADGGRSDASNYKMVRKTHNLRMGTMNLMDYKKVYDRTHG